MTTDAAPPPAGLRLRKRERTRLAITGAAFRLFAERGFDAVTVTEIAAAADVAPATIFTHFATKEDIFFSRGLDFTTGLPEVIDSATDGDLPVRLGEFFRRTITEVVTSDWASARAFARILLGSPALRRSYLPLVRAWQDLITNALLARSQRDEDTAEIALFSALVITTVSVAMDAMHIALATDAPARQVRKTIDAGLDRGFARLAGAYPDGLTAQRPPAP
ncbi:transcriptional regulator, TetR family protein [Streptomyces bingchenggensis BCW-1]|uniref:Transcriptional regulator, TetR family protein n=1 Tax=Streptomyces bingchenggensis (strain BCW-1) TaxID=749414 RepID=D7BW88_STRBB|nr:MULTISPECIES: TetR/AcrR family transcriptional regulator [Streptomyces]ADI11798.1 transcriptional regulator, TetR family protein [Streptomyces bingchenggensis BCW-1]